METTEHKGLNKGFLVHPLGILFLALKVIVSLHIPSHSFPWSTVGICEVASQENAILREAKANFCVPQTYDTGFICRSLTKSIDKLKI